MSERIPTAEDVRLALIEVGYTHYEADDAIERIKQRGIGIGQEMARETMQASIGGAFRKAQAIAWDEDAAKGSEVGADAIILNPMHTNPYREEASDGPVRRGRAGMAGRRNLSRGGVRDMAGG